MLLLMIQGLFIRLILEVLNFLFRDFIYLFIFIFNIWLEIKKIARAAAHLAEDCFVCLLVKM